MKRYRLDFEQSGLHGAPDALQRLRGKTAGRQACYEPLSALLLAILDRAFKWEL